MFCINSSWTSSWRVGSGQAWAGRTPSATDVGTDSVFHQPSPQTPFPLMMWLKAPCTIQPAPLARQSVCCACCWNHCSVLWQEGLRGCSAGGLAAPGGWKEIFLAAPTAFHSLSSLTSKIFKSYLPVQLLSLLLFISVLLMPQLHH